MDARKIIAVVGATGAQGGGLVRAILNDPDSGFIPRAITRDVKSAKAKELADLGAEVVAADIDDVKTLKEAFQGAYAGPGRDGPVRFAPRPARSRAARAGRARFRSRATAA